jgi:regulator of sigma E protease
MSYALILLVIGFLITLHEFGHLVAARVCGIPVERFSVGFGPKLWTFSNRGTSYWLSAVPLGGYVLPGLDESEFQALPVTRRILFALGGPAANAASGFVCLLAFNLATMESGFLTILRVSASKFAELSLQLLGAIPGLFANPENISGFLGIIKYGGDHFGSTILGLLMFEAILNINLAVLNLLPIPPLDGARVVFCVLERIHRPILRLQRPATILGWRLILFLMFYVTVQDITRLVVAEVA